METTKMIVKELEVGLEIFFFCFCKPQKLFCSSFFWILSFNMTVNLHILKCFHGVCWLSESVLLLDLSNYPCI